MPGSRPPLLAVTASIDEHNSFNPIVSNSFRDTTKLSWLKPDLNISLSLLNGIFPHPLVIANTPHL